MERLRDVHAAPPRKPRVAVLAASDPPVAGAWNVQLFHGLGDKAYTLNPVFLQRGRFPRARTAMNIAAGMVGLPRRWLAPPAQVTPRRCRYQQLNAYGPRWVDLFAERVKDVDVTRFGHVALNELEGLRSDPDGPVLWLPTWDNRRTMGGPMQSSLDPMAADVMALARSGVPVLIKLHPLTVANGQAHRVRRELAATSGIDMVPADSSAYKVLEGCRGVLTDTSSMGFEAYAAGLPVAVVTNPGVRPTGLHEELAERAARVEPGDASLAAWAERPEPPADHAWASDLLFPPEPRTARTAPASRSARNS